MIICIIYFVVYGLIYIYYTEWFFYPTTLSISKILIDFKTKSVVYKKTCCINKEIG